MTEHLNKLTEDLPRQAQDLGKLWIDFANYSLGDYAPIYDRITRAMANDTEIMELVLAGPTDARLPNNLNAAVRFLTLDMPDHPLTAIYAGESSADPVPLYRQVALEHRDEVLDILRNRKVQTNEVRRTAAIAPALALVGQRYKKPLSLIDAGSSAGLNLLVDRYRIDYGTTAFGPTDAPLTVTSRLVGAGEPMAGPLDIAWRRGFDRSPINVADPDQERWLRALVWPSHHERYERLNNAIQILQSDPPELVQAEALDGLALALQDAPDHTMPVVVTSWVYFYFPKELRQAFDAAIVAAKRPVAWVSMEIAGIVEGLDGGEPPASESEPNVIGLVVGGAGTEPVRKAVGWTHGHGTWVDWRA